MANTEWGPLAQAGVLAQVDAALKAGEPTIDIWQRIAKPAGVSLEVVVMRRLDLRRRVKVGGVR